MVRHEGSVYFVLPRWIDMSQKTIIRYVLDDLPDDNYVGSRRVAMEDRWGVTDWGRRSLNCQLRDHLRAQLSLRHARLTLATALFVDAKSGESIHVLVSRSIAPGSSHRSHQSLRSKPSAPHGSRVFLFSSSTDFLTLQSTAPRATAANVLNAPLFVPCFEEPRTTKDSRFYT